MPGTRWALLVAAVLIWPISAAGQENVQSANHMQSANYMIEPCRRLAINGPSSTIDDAFTTGFCTGILYTLLKMGPLATPNACIPQAVSVGQLARVVVAYLEKSPARLHESLLDLAAEAMIRAWPCAAGNSK